MKSCTKKLKTQRRHLNFQSSSVNSMSLREICFLASRLPCTSCGPHGPSSLIFVSWTRDKQFTSCWVNYHWRKPRFVLSIFEPISCVLLADMFITWASQIIKKAYWISGKFLYRDILVKMENKKGCWLKICACLKLFTLALQCWKLNFWC